MKIIKNLKNIKYYLCFAFIIYSIFVTTGNIIYFTKKIKISGVPLINLGIDIAGGNQLTILMGISEILLDQYKILENNILKECNEKKIEISNNEINSSGINIVINQINYENFQKIIQNLDKNLLIFQEKIQNNQIKIRIYYNSNIIENINSETINKAIQILKNRIDGIGLQDIAIQRYGINKLIILIPNGIDNNRIKNIISTTAKLTFHIITTHDIYLEKPKIQIKDKKIVTSYQNNNIFYIIGKSEISGQDLLDARPNNDGLRNVITFKFNANGSKEFARATKKAIGNLLAISLDDKILMAPMVNEAIIGGQGMITGSFNQKEALDLSILLRSGSLPVTLSIIEEKNISSSFGDNIIQNSKTPIIIALIIIALFMILRYKKLGLIANITIIVNIIMTFTIMSILGFTLTIPGIAGILLIPGMAIDANILIYEKMKEIYLFDNYKKASDIIKFGFKGAMFAIVDSNFTTIIASITLIGFGNSFLKGFAITLIVGILCSMFTSINLTKIIIQFTINKKERNNFRPF